MTAPLWLALAIIAVVGACAWLAIWSRRDTWARPAAVALFLAAIPTVGYAMAETLGRHKPVAIDWGFPTGPVLVLAAKLVQDEAIYLYIEDPRRVEPLPRTLPWSNEMAQKIQAAMDGAPQGREGQFILSIPLADDGQHSEIEAHPVPQPPSPPVKAAPEGGVIYTPPQ